MLVQVRFVPSDGGERTKTNHQQLVPRWGKLVFVEAMVGMVVHTGADTLWALSGGAAGAAVAAVETKRREAQEEALVRPHSPALPSVLPRVPTYRAAPCHTSPVSHHAPACSESGHRGAPRGSAGHASRPQVAGGCNGHSVVQQVHGRA